MVRAFGIMALVVLSCAAGAARGADAETAETLLTPLIQFAEDRLKSIDEEIRDYTCTLVKRERFDGRLRDYEYMSVKLRQPQISQGKVKAPFSIYLRYLAPADLKGREVVYVDGWNRGKIVVWRGGPRLSHVTTAVDPTSDLALHWGHYPITDAGMRTLTERLLAIGKQELIYQECDVKYVEGVKINDRSCLMVQVTHPRRRPHFNYYMAQVFIDQEMKLPIRYASYDWPSAQGEPAPLIEEYTFLDIRLNVGLTDADFDFRNPAYRFRKTFEP